MNMTAGMSSDATRLCCACGLALAYLAVCVGVFLRARRKRALSGRDGNDGVPSWIVAYASQTGNAEELASQTAATLRLAGVTLRLCQFDALRAADLQNAERILFLTSTYGEGDAPDNAAAFSGRLLGDALNDSLALGQLHYAVLALGDSSYAQFCGFGRALDRWLEERGASRLFDTVEVDRSASAAIERWRQQLSHLAGTSDAPDWSAPAFAGWTLAARRLVNPGSAGAPLYHLEFVPQSGTLPPWSSGDLAQVAVPGESAQPRDYSIASIPLDGRVHLLVRLQRQADGSDGLASGWLTQRAQVGDVVDLRLRQHRRFRLDDNAARPLILIGNGSGMAGLRGHLKSRVAAGLARNWLLFGERHSTHDYHYRDEIARWQADGFLPQLDMVFSRDQSERIHVQDRLLARADEVRRWLDDDAAIYVCGSLEGMAGGVDAALVSMLGRPALDALAAQGRYRRDVY